MTRTTSTVLALAFACAVLPPSQARARSARDLLDRAQQLDDTTRHWNDRVQEMSLIIHGGNGERRRELKVYTKRYGKGEEKSISFFLSPPEVKGTGFLQWAHAARDDEQWLYLPEFKRTRHISTSLRDERFVGTDFTYRDLEILGEVLRWSETEAPSRLLGEETVDGVRCDLIELRPQQRGMPYARLRLWLDHEQLTPRRLEFDDRNDTRLKRLELGDVRLVGSIPTAHHMEMRDLEKGTSTTVELRRVVYDSQLPDDMFTRGALERGTH